MSGFVLNKDCKNKQDCVLMALWCWKTDTTLSPRVLTQTPCTNSFTSCLPTPLCCLGLMVRKTQGYCGIWESDIPLHLEWSPRSHIFLIGSLLNKSLSRQTSFPGPIF